MTDVLKLVLTDHWFEEIKSGRKTHEYRKATNFWKDRLDKFGAGCVVQFQKAYRKNPERILFEIKNISVINGKNTDLHCDEPVFDIKLGERIKSQNTKNEQQKDLCITSEQMTEQWNKEHSIKENQHYYIKDTRDNIYVDYFWGDGWLDNLNEDILEVLAPVPTYEEWQAIEKYNKHLEEVIKVYEQKDKQATETSIAYGELLEENEKRKELLNKAFVYVHNDCLKNLRVGYTPLSALLIKDIIKALKEYRRKNATEFIYVEDDKDD